MFPEVPLNSLLFLKQLVDFRVYKDYNFICFIHERREGWTLKYTGTHIYGLKIFRYYYWILIGWFKTSSHQIFQTIIFFLYKRSNFNIIWVINKFTVHFLVPCSWVNKHEQTDATCKKLSLCFIFHLYNYLNRCKFVNVLWYNWPI